MMRKQHMFRAVLIMGLVLHFVQGIAQQDAQYSQYMFNPLAVNPAYAGSREVLATALVYREQWTGIKGAPSTAAFSVQMPMKMKKIGLGCEIASDKLGPKSVSSFLLSYAYRIRFSKGKLAFGLRAGMYNYVYDWSIMDYKDKSDLYNTGNRTSKLTGTGDFGWYYYTRTFYWGMGFTHLNRGKITDISSGDSTARLAAHFFMPISKAFEVGNVIINPTLLIKGATHSPSMIDLSCNVRLKERIWLGISLRSGYGTVLLTQYQINEKMKVGYSYDMGVNKIGRVGKGSHEIMIGYDINIHGSKMAMPRYL